MVLAVKCLPTLYTLSKMRGTQNMMDGFRTVASPFSPLFTMVLLYNGMDIDAQKNAYLSVRVLG